MAISSALAPAYLSIYLRVMFLSHSVNDGKLENNAQCCSWWLSVLQNKLVNVAVLWPLLCTLVG